MAFITPVAGAPWVGIPLQSTLSRSINCQPALLSKKTTARSRVVAVSTSPTRERSAELVQTLLQKLSGSDVGLRMNAADRESIDAIIEELNQIGKYQQPMTDPNLFGKYNVAYSKSNNDSPPAGGLFGTAVGRLIFRSRGLFQHVFKPDTVVNLVCFRVLGFLKGCVSLRGKLVALPNDPLGPNAIEVTFERPRLQFGSAVFQFGPRSRVRLATTYLDKNVRLGVGGRGSTFVFTRGGNANIEMADEWNHVFQAQPLPVVIIPIAIASILAVSILAPLPVRVAAFALAGMAGYVLKRGGIADNGPSAIRD